LARLQHASFPSYIQPQLVACKNKKGRGGGWVAMYLQIITHSSYTTANDRKVSYEVCCSGKISWTQFQF